MMSVCLCAVGYSGLHLLPPPHPSDAPSDMEDLELSEHDTTPGAARKFILYHTCVCLCVCVCVRERERARARARERHRECVVGAVRLMVRLMLRPKR
jgi:hypothetical protein